MKLTKPMKGFEIPQDEIETMLQKLIDEAGYCFASIKWDGYRCRAFGGKAWSSSGKLIVNRSVQAAFAKAKLPDGLDGELIVNDNDFQLTQSFIQRRMRKGHSRIWCLTLKIIKNFVFDTISIRTLCSKILLTGLIVFVRIHLQVLVTFLMKKHSILNTTVKA